MARAARLLAAGILHQRVDLDDIGAPVRQLPHAGRPGADARVRSSAVKRDGACEARGKGIQRAPEQRTAGNRAFLLIGQFHHKFNS